MKILLSGGGTGGHINPAIAIANYVTAKEKDTQILFVGNRGTMEERLVPKAGYNITYIRVSGLKRRITLENFRTAARLVSSYNASKKILRDFAPDVVVGTGGYVCLPVMLAAIHMHIPTIIHEQNVFPGLAVRMVAGRASVTATSFAETARYFKKPPRRIEVTGNPIRPDLLQPQPPKTGGEPTILISGGSLGAGRINETLLELLQMQGQNYYGILAATGVGNYDAFMEKVRAAGIKLCANKKIVPYIYNMDEALAQADLAVTRAGAITVSELCAIGKPAILIPSPNVTNDHQTYNARYMEERGAAVLIPETQLSGELLAGQIRTLLSDRARLEKMSKAGKAAAITTACETIYNLIRELCG